MLLYSLNYALINHENYNWNVCCIFFLKYLLTSNNKNLVFYHCSRSADVLHCPGFQSRPQVAGDVINLGKMRGICGITP